MRAMDRFHEMQVFVAVADAGGFAPAARRLGLSPPAVTRAVAALEERVGARLLVRTTRSVRLTEAGARFHLDAKRLLKELAEAEAAAAGAHGEPQGELHVTAPVLFGRMHVTPLLLDFMEAFPRVQVRTLFLDRILNLVEEGMDVGVRIGALPDSSLTAVRVGHVRRILCAAPDYLERRGEPRVPADLAAHDTIVQTAVNPTPEWVLHGPDGPRAVTLVPKLTAHAADVAIAAVLAGRGVARLLSYMVAPDLAAGRLRVLMEDHEPPPLPIHLVHQEGRRASARVRAFVDFAVERLRAEPAINGPSAGGPSAGGSAPSS